MNNQALINEIRSKVDIVDIISSYVPLVQKGKNYFGICPFHNDNHPSMSVSRDKQIYKCFSCGASGNVFTFLMNYEHIEFPEALKILSDKTGVSLGNLNIKKQFNKYDKLYEIYDLANKFYQNNINTSEGKSAKEYLQQRSIDDEVIKTFEIGLSTTNDDDLYKLLTKKGYDPLTLEKIGLTSGNGDIYRRRIMFPLYDVTGKTVGFSGRIYKNSSQSKYVNTRETVIFKKGNCLYNYHRAKEEARTAGSIIIMEGFMDVIRAYTIGYKNVIALMGTALTDEQANLIKKLSWNVYLCLDGDNPGRQANIKVGEQLEKIGINPKVIPLSNDDDPDTYILKNKKEGFDRLFNSAIPFTDYKLQMLKLGVNFNSDIDLTNYVNKVLKEVSVISDEIRREIILKKLAIETNLSYNTLEKRLREFVEENDKKVEVVLQKPKTEKRKTKIDKATFGLIYAMLTNDKLVEKIEKANLVFEEQTTRYLVNEIIYYYKKFSTISIADFYTYLQDKEELLELYNQIISSDVLDNIDDKVVDDYINVIKEYNKSLEIKRLEKLIKETIDDIEKSKIAEQIRQLKLKE